MTPQEALEKIQQLMSGVEWDSGTMSAVAEVMNEAGYSILDLQDDQPDYQTLASDAGFFLRLTSSGKYQWVSPDEKTVGVEKHMTQDEAWEECCETNNLRSEEG